MPPTGPRGPAGGTTLTAPFRCAAAALDRGDDPAGSATHVAAFLLVEHHGPWGVAVLRDSRLDADVRQHLSGVGAVRVLLARRHHRAHRGSTYAVHLCFPHTQRLLRREVADHRELLDLDVAALARGEEPAGWEADPGPLYGVCTHGRHDACCAERGRPVALALAASRHAEATWECSHIGGDRFAGNLLVLPRGHYYGRVDPASAIEVADAVADGRLALDHLRGRSDVAMPVQAAEIDVRRRLGLNGLDDVRPTSARTEADLTTVSLDAAGRPVRVRVRRLLGEPGRLTCGAARDNPVPRFEVEPEG